MTNETKTTSNRRAIIFFIFFALILLSGLLYARIHNSAYDGMPVRGEMVLATLTPTMGQITYTCPTDDPCNRTGSSEWFEASSIGTSFRIELFGDAQITAATDRNGDVGFEVDYATNTINFKRNVGRILLTIVGPEGPNSGYYGVRR